MSNNNEELPDNSTELSSELTNEAAEQALARQALRAEYKELALQGLWKNNPGLVQLLGLCPFTCCNSNSDQCLRLGLSYIIGFSLL